MKRRMLKRSTSFAVMLVSCLALACSKLETGDGVPDAGDAPSGGASGTSGSGGAGGTGGIGGATGGSGGDTRSGGSGGSAGGCMGRMCGDQCIAPDVETPSACGPDCEVCPAPLGGAASCVGGMCGSACELGWHACGSPEQPDTWACMNDVLAESCGTRCEPCATPENGSATCVDATCGFECDNDHLACVQDSTCVHVRWGFDDATDQGFELQPEDSGAVTGAASASTEQQYDGTHSLRIPYDSAAAGRNVSVHLPLCESGGMDLRNRTIRMMVRIDETETTMVYPYAGHIQIATGAGGVSNVTNDSIDAGEWTFLTGTLEEEASEVLTFGFYVYAQHNAQGFLYIDDIAIE